MADMNSSKEAAWPLTWLVSSVVSVLVYLSVALYLGWQVFQGHGDEMAFVPEATDMFSYKGALIFWAGCAVVPLVLMSIAWIKSKLSSSPRSEN
jgi:hypothetical protein